MSIKSKKTQNTNNIAPANDNKTTYDVTVSNARFLPSADNTDVVAFDMVANGVRIYGMIYRAGLKADGEEYEMISFPSQKSKNDKYYSHCWFPMSKALKESIIAELEKLLDAEE